MPSTNIGPSFRVSPQIASSRRLNVDGLLRTEQQREISASVALSVAELGRASVWAWLAVEMSMEFPFGCFSRLVLGPVVDLVVGFDMQ